MTVQSVIGAAINLVQTQLPASFVTVEELDNRTSERFKAAELPGLFFTASPSSQRQAAYNVAEEIWDVEGHIWRFDDYSTSVNRLTTFRALVEAVRELFSAHPQLDGAADTSRSQLSLIGAEVQTQYSKPIRRTNHIERLALVKFRVSDWLL